MTTKENKQDHFNWRTSNEKDYILGLATGSNLRWYPHVPVISRTRLFLNYIESAKKRMAWGTFGQVDGNEVIEYAKAQVEKLSKSDD